MDKGTTCKSCCKLKEGANEMGRCESVRLAKQKLEKQDYIERLRRQSERRKQERIDNPDKFREREKSTEKQTQRR